MWKIAAISTRSVFGLPYKGIPAKTLMPTLFKSGRQRSPLDDRKRTCGCFGKLILEPSCKFRQGQSVGRALSANSQGNFQAIGRSSMGNKLPLLKPREVQGNLRALGFVHKRTDGSHETWERLADAIIPERKIVQVDVAKKQ